jgi:hypothetical protein
LVSMREDWIADSTASAIAASCDGIGTPISIPLCNPTFRFSPMIAAHSSGVSARQGA